VLHYCLTQRDDAPLWRYCQSMVIPDSLRERIELFTGTGRIRPLAGELFTDLSWFYILEGLGARPRGHDPLLDVVPVSQLSDILVSIARANAAIAKAAPPHDSYFNPAAASQGRTPTAP
jgi:tryptophan 7-halogenase